MIEYLFRGKQRISGEWITGFLVDGQHIGCWLESDPVRPESVGQFTGLFDSTKWGELTPDEQNAFLHQPDGWENTPDVWHGKPIFEGDIVQAHFRNNHSKQTFRVIFEDGMFLFDNFCVKVPKYDIYSTKVIGNIHDNPELLEGGVE